MKNQEAAEIDQFIRERKYLLAKRRLSKITMSKVAVDQRHLFANLARRLHQPQKAIKFLWSNIHELGRDHFDDVSEYASTLRSLGLVNEALRLLNRLGDSTQADLYKAFCYISIWDYTSAQTCLQEGLKKIGSSYHPKKDVFEVNLAASQILNGDVETAKASLKKLESGGIEQRNRLLYINVLENLVHIDLLNRNFVSARQKLEKAFQANQSAGDFYTVMLKKWQCLLKVASSGFDEEVIEDFKSLARREKHWESLRDFDFQLAKIQKAMIRQGLGPQRIEREIQVSLSERLEKLYFGSPFEGFKKRVEDEVGLNKHQSTWVDKRCSAENMRSLDFYTVGQGKVPLGLTMHRFLMVLASDQYRPWSVGRLFDQLYPDESFNPLTSAKRIQQLVNKTRKVLKSLSMDIEIKATSCGYRLRPVGDLELTVHSRLQFTSQIDFVWHQLQAAMDDKNWSTRQELAQMIELSSDQWFRILSQLKQEGYIDSEGVGKGMKYRLKAS